MFHFSRLYFHLQLIAVANKPEEQCPFSHWRPKFTWKWRWLRVKTAPKMVKEFQKSSLLFTSHHNVSIVKATLVLVKVNGIPGTRLMAVGCGYETKTKTVTY